MKVLFIGPLPPPVTGHAIACQILLDHLREQHEAAVVNLSKPELTSGVSSLARFGTVFGILREVRRQRTGADVIYLTISESVAGNIKDLLIYCLCARRLSRVVVHLHGGSLKAWIFDKHPLLRALNRYFLARLGAIIVLGPSHFRIFEGIVASERVHAIANFAEDYVFGTEEQIAAKFAHPEPVRVLFLSNLISGKGHEDMVAAYFALAAADRARIRLDFAGAFESAADERRFTGAIAGDAGIVYHGVVGGTRKRELLAQAHALCLPTQLLEGQPISILEAYAAGCVVLTTPRGGIPDVFADRVNGLQVTPGEPQSLSGVFAELLRTPQSLLPMALHNFRAAQTLYRASRYTGEVGALLERIGGGYNEGHVYR